MDTTRPDEMAAKTALLLPMNLGDGTTDHPVLSIPFTAEIDGRHCLGLEISLVRAQVAGLLDPALDGQERLVRLSFSFHGFAVTLAVSCRIALVGGAAGKAALIFTDPTGDHLPQLRHLLNGWIAGDLVSIGQVLGTATTGPANSGGKAGARPGDQSGPGILSRLVGSLAMLALAAGLVAAVMLLTYVRGYLVTLPAPARIVAEGQVLAALAPGQIDYVNTAAAAGEVAFTLRTDGGQVLSVTMPCDCVASLEGVAPGATVQAGDPVMTVHAPGAPLAARVEVSPDMLFDIARADSAVLTLPDGRNLSVRPSLPLPAPAGRASDLVTVTFVADGLPLDAALAGTIAEVTLTRRIPTFLEPARALHRASGW
jgi:mannuronan synthase